MAVLKYKDGDGNYQEIVGINVVQNEVVQTTGNSTTAVMSQKAVTDELANEKQGNGIGTCSTSSGTALVVSLTGYELVQNGFVAVTFSNDVPASATLNINGKGAKPIYYKGSAIDADTIKADDTVMFCYDGTNYVVTSLGGESGGSAAGLEIVEAFGTTLNAEVGKYYRYDSDVTNLAVTLPTITGATETQDFKLYFNTGSTNPSITFSGGTIKRFGNLVVTPNNNYEIGLSWNGSIWALQTNEALIYDSKIEYIQCSGGQWIDTLTYLDYNSTIYVKFMQPIIDDNITIFGQSPDYWINDWSLGTEGGNISYVPARQDPLSIGFTANTIYEAYADKDGLKINGTSYSKALPSGYAGTRTMYVFATHRSTAVQGSGSWRLYRLTIYQGSVIALDLIPVRVGAVGYMYDLVSKKLFGNSGTGNFTLGPDV